MIADDYIYMIMGAQNFISTQIQKKTLDTMSGSIWGTKSLNLGPNEYGLVIYQVKEKVIFPFTRSELIEGYGSREWKTRLLTRVNKIVRRLSGNDSGGIPR